MNRWLKAALAGAAAIAPVWALAAIDGTHHDMNHMTVSNEKCAYCHSITGLVATPGYGNTGAFCVKVCHDGTTTSTAGIVPTGPGILTAWNGTAFTPVASTPAATVVSFGVSHGATAADLATIDEAQPTDTPADVAATNWPHSAEANFQCTSCHAVHDNTNPPFLNAALSGASNAASFCQRCHTGSTATTAGFAGRYQDFAAAGAHPTQFAWSVAGAAGRTGAKTGDANTIMNGRTIAMKDGIFNVTIPATPNAVGTSWATGGHLAGGTQFGCYTCHSAHQEQEGGTDLILVNTLADKCYGCHGDGPNSPTGAATTEENPGITNFYHPVNSEAALARGAMQFPIPMAGAYTALSTGAKGYRSATATSPLCVSCHDVHGGMAGKMAIRNLGQGNTNSVCLGCHAASTDNTGAVSFHHPGKDDAGSNYIGDGWANASWATAENLGLLSDGLSCPDCHTVQSGRTIANQRATGHNW